MKLRQHTGQDVRENTKCLSFSEARSSGGAAQNMSASRRAPSGPRPFPPLSSMALVPLSPTPLTSLTIPVDDTCPRPRPPHTRSPPLIFTALTRHLQGSPYQPHPSHYWIGCEFRTAGARCRTKLLALLEERRRNGTADLESSSVGQHG
jgi:hypothetical protein